MNNENSFKTKLKQECNKHNINLNDDQLSKFEEYKNLLLEWNEKINLTAITDELEIIVKHFVDCLEVTKYIKINENNKVKKDTTKVIDVGTGAGFPGLVICIFFEGKINITLLDALNKRINFLQDVITKLKLENIELVHKRAEDGAHDLIYREKYDYVVSRAVASLNILLEYTIPYLKKQGSGLYLKGDKIKKEINNSFKAFKVLKTEIWKEYEYFLEINKEKFTRHILEVKKQENTNLKYPRSFGKIKKLPL